MMPGISIHRNSRCFLMNNRASSQPSMAITISLSKGIVCVTKVGVKADNEGEWRAIANLK